MNRLNLATDYVASWWNGRREPLENTGNLRPALDEVLVSDLEEEEGSASGAQGRRYYGDIMYHSEDDPDPAHNQPAFIAPDTVNTPRPRNQRVHDSSDYILSAREPFTTRSSSGESTHQLSQENDLTSLDLSGDDSTNSTVPPMPPLSPPGTESEEASEVRIDMPPARKKNRHNIDLGNERDVYARTLQRVSVANIHAVKQSNREFQRQMEARTLETGDVEMGGATPMHWLPELEKRREAFLAQQKQELLEQFYQGISENQALYIDLLKSIKSTETSKLKAEFDQAMTKLGQRYKDHPWIRQLWIFLSGLVANLFCFGPGNVYNVFVGALHWDILAVLAAVLIASGCWQMFQALVDNLRPTSADNPHITTYTEIGYWGSRSMRDRVYKKLGLEIEKYYFVTKNPETGLPEPRYLTAAEIRDTYNMRRAFRSQFPSDQCSYSFYVINGFLASVILDVFGTVIFGQLTLPLLIVNKVAGRLIQGAFAGGFTALAFQFMREYFIKHKMLGFDRGEVKLTKERENWGQEAAYLAPFIQDIKDYLHAHPELAENLVRALNKTIEGLEYDLERAQAKSGWFSSLWIEWKLSLASKRVPMDADPDFKLTGNAMATTGSFMGKITCLSPVAVATILTAPMRAPEAPVLNQIMGNLIVSTTLIFLGFVARVELGVGYTILLGGARGFFRGLGKLHEEVERYMQKELAQAEINRQVARHTRGLAGYPSDNDDAGASSSGPAATGQVRFAEQDLEEDSGAQADTASAQHGGGEVADLPDEVLEEEARKHVERIQQAEEAIMLAMTDPSLSEEQKQQKSRHLLMDVLKPPNGTWVVREQDSSDQTVLPARRAEDSSDIFIGNPEAEKKAVSTTRPEKRKKDAGRKTATDRKDSLTVDVAQLLDKGQADTGPREQEQEIESGEFGLADENLEKPEQDYARRLKKANDRLDRIQARTDLTDEQKLTRSARVMRELQTPATRTRRSVRTRDRSAQPAQASASTRRRKILQQDSASSS